MRERTRRNREKNPVFSASRTRRFSGERVSRNTEFLSRGGYAQTASAGETKEHIDTRKSTPYWGRCGVFTTIN